MTSKVILSMLGAGLVMGLSASALAQGNRGDNNQRGDSAYSQNDNGRGQNARNTNKRQKANRADNNQRGQNARRRGPKVKIFPTRFSRTRIILTENFVRAHRGPQKLCTVSVRGPQARLVPKKRLRRVARNNCSRRAKIQISRIGRFNRR